MKTLGDTGLMPEKMSGKSYPSMTYNKVIDEISAIPLLTVVRKAVEGGLVRINLCHCPDRDERGDCPDCNGTGFVITELQSELEKEG